MNTTTKKEFVPEYKLNVLNNPFGDTLAVESIINRVFAKINEKRGFERYPPSVKVHKMYYYDMAVTHKSFLSEQQYIHDPRNGYTAWPTQEEIAANPKLAVLMQMKPDFTYERIEVIGDSVIGLIVTDFLYEKFPDRNENFMTVVKSRLVEKEMLAHFSRCIGLVPHILISSFHEQLADKNQGRNHQSIQEDVFEAFVGAIYKDYIDAGKRGLGFEIVTNFVRAVIELYAGLDYILTHNKNFKNSLIMYFQNQRFNGKNSKVEFIQAFSEGPTNNREFAICALLPRGIAQELERELPGRDYHKKTIDLLCEILCTKKDNVDLCGQIQKNVLSLDRITRGEYLIVGFGHAKTKRQAEQNASRDGMLTLGIDLNYGYLQ